MLEIVRDVLAVYGRRLGLAVASAALCAGPAFGTPGTPDVQDLWWAGLAKSGWGVSIVQHGDTPFTVLYVYDHTAHTSWYVMPGGTWNDARDTYSGPIYHPQGTHFTAYEASRLVAGEPIGHAELAFASLAEATLRYNLGRSWGEERLTRQLFGPLATSPLLDLTDMWWGGEAQNGWGVAIIQQHASLFAVWFTYNRDGTPAWYVMPAGAWSDDDTYEGRLYRPCCTRWLDRTFDPSRLAAPDLGPVRIRFLGAGQATFEYSVSGQTGTLLLSRQPF